MAKRPGRANRMGALVVSLGVMIGASACAPIHTLDIFDPSDGVRATLGDEVKATNLLILTEEEGAPGTLVGSLSNLTDGDLAVDVTVNGAAGVNVELPAGHTAYLTPRTPSFDGPSFAFDAQIDAVGTPPGGTADVVIATTSGGEATVQVPVLDGTLEPYDEYLP